MPQKNLFKLQKQRAHMNPWDLSLVYDLKVNTQYLKDLRQQTQKFKFALAVNLSIGFYPNEEKE